jgi:hypothetical protein
MSAQVIQFSPEAIRRAAAFLRATEVEAQETEASDDDA